jgi:hypothetical protein
VFNPFNGVRRRRLGQWLMELAVVVTGVLIALWVQQWADARSSKRKAIDAEYRIRDELAANTDLWLERVAVRHCLRDRLGKLANALGSGQADWQAMTVTGYDADRMAFRRLYRTPSRNWQTDAYRGALGNGDLESVNFDQRYKLAVMYKQIDRMAELNLKENDLRSKLSTLQFNPVLTTPERNALLATITELDWINGLMVLIARQNFEGMHSLGYNMSSEEIAKARAPEGWQKATDEMREKYGDCVQTNALAEFEPAFVVPPQSASN